MFNTGNDPNDKPFEMTSQEPQDVGDNTPILFTSAQAGSQQALPGSKPDRVLWYTIGGIVITACCVVFLLVYTFIRSDPFQNLFSYEPPTPFPTLGPRDLTATQRAWIRPAQSPTLGNIREAERAIKENGAFDLRLHASRGPSFMPEINMPGDIYIYEINIDRNEDALWEYGWCTTTEGILKENLAQMEVAFVVNGILVSGDRLAVTEYQRSDDGYCRSLTALITYWPPGQHQLETRITFRNPTDDGWNVYPAGTHIFKYFVNVED